MNKFKSIIILCFFVLAFFWQFFLKGLLPIPSDTIVGLYYPYRDYYSKNYPNGIPFKNFLITDPVRQLYPWKKLAIDQLKKMELPIWNPYSFSGTPLLANSQSGVFYPLNLVFLIPNFSFAWSIFIILGPLLGGIFLFIYLKNLGLKAEASILGSITFIFCGFSTAWLEWGNVIHTALWLPLVLLSIDKILASKIRRKELIWFAVFIFSLASSFFAGHLQIFFYLFIVSFLYLIFRMAGKKAFKSAPKFLASFGVFLLLISPQLIPFLKFVALSARSMDRASFINQPGWFLPWQNLAQFLVPDFFGNPATLNYWGTWNYGELVGYVGIFPLIMAFAGISLLRKRREVLFFLSVAIISLVLALPTPLSKIPFILNVPFLSTAQPTRLLFLVCFSLSILAGFGFDLFLRSKTKIHIYAALATVLIFLTIIIYIKIIPIFPDFLSVTQRNILFPGIILLISSLAILVSNFANNSSRRLILTFLILLTLFDLFRFSSKFNPFTDRKYLFPKTSTISFLTKNSGNFRIMNLDARIFPPNFSNYYRLQSVSGYDPIFLKRYAELISASEKNEPNISQISFNRIINPSNTQSPIVNILGVKYFLSLKDISGDVKKVFQEGNSRIYENLDVLPRSFFVSNLRLSSSKEESINSLFDSSFKPLDTAVVEGYSGKTKFTKGKVKIIKYSENNIQIQTDSGGSGFLVLSDIYYPNWKAKIKVVNGWENIPIFLTDYAFRGILVPKGRNTIVFYDKLF